MQHIRLSESTQRAGALMQKGKERMACRDSVHEYTCLLKVVVPTRSRLDVRGRNDNND